MLQRLREEGYLGRNYSPTACYVVIDGDSWYSGGSSIGCFDIQRLCCVAVLLNNHEGYDSERLQSSFSPSAAMKSCRFTDVQSASRVDELLVHYYYRTHPIAARAATAAVLVNQAYINRTVYEATAVGFKSGELGHCMIGHRGLQRFRAR